MASPTKDGEFDILVSKVYGRNEGASQPVRVMVGSKFDGGVATPLIEVRNAETGELLRTFGDIVKSAINIDSGGSSKLYLHIKYSDDGVSFTSDGGETPGSYLGMYVDTVKADSETFSDYAWARVGSTAGNIALNEVSRIDSTVSSAASDAAKAQAAADAAQAEAEAQTAKIQALVEDGEKKQAQIDANTAQAAIDQERTNCSNDMYMTSAKNIVDVMGNQGSLKASTGQLIFTAASSKPTASHTGDLWLDTANGKAYKWNGSSWAALDGGTAEDDTAKLIVAANVEGSPFKVFTTQPATPYKVGDLYLTDIEKGDIYRCIKAREEGDYSADDWCVTSSYDSAMSQLMRALDAGKANLEQKAKELKAKADSAYAEADALGQVATNQYKVEYIQTDSATTKPSQDATGWSTTAPARTTGKYIWMRSTYYIGTGDHAQLTHSEPSCITGDAGKDGTGKDGVSVTGSDTFYILATEPPETPTGAEDPSGWSKTEPTPADDYTGNEYRCIRTTLSDGTPLWTTPTVVASFSFAQKAYSTASGTAEKWSKIDKTVEEYNSTYGTTYDTIDGVLLKMSSNIKQNSDGITLKADSRAVINSNLLRDSGFNLDKHYWVADSGCTLTYETSDEKPSGETATDNLMRVKTAGNARCYYDVGDFSHEKGTTYRLTLWYYVSTNQSAASTLTIGLYDVAQVIKTISLPTKECAWHKVDVTYKASRSGSLTLRTSSAAEFVVYHPCLTIAPGTDKYVANGDELTTSAQLSVKSNSILSTVKDTYATKEGLEETNSTVTQLSDSVTTKFTSLKGAITEWVADPDFKQGAANVDGWNLTPSTSGITQSRRDNIAGSTSRRQLSKGTVIRCEATVNCASMADNCTPNVIMYASSTKDGGESYWPAIAKGTKNSKTVQKLFRYYTVPDAYDGWWFRVGTQIAAETTAGETGSVTWTHVRVTDVTSATEDSTLIHQTSDGVAVGKGTQDADGNVTWTSGQFHTLQGNGTFQVQDSGGKVYTSIGAGTATIGKSDGYNTNITSSAVQLRNGSTTLAQVSGSTATIGQTSGLNTYIDGNGIYMRNGTSTTLAKWNASSLLLGQTSGSYPYNLYATGDGLYLRNGTTNLASMKSSGVTIGQSSGAHTVVDTSGMTIYDGSGNDRASYTGSEISLGGGALQITGSGTTSYLKQKGVFSSGIMELCAMNGINLNGIANIPAMTVTPEASYQLELSSSLRMIDCSVTKSSVLSRMTSYSTSYGGVSGYGISSSTFNTPFSPKVSGFATFEGVSSGTNCILAILDYNTLVAYGIATAAGGFCTVSIPPIVVPSRTAHIFKLAARTGNATGYIGSNSGEDNLKTALTATF